MQTKSQHRQQLLLLTAKNKPATANDQPASRAESIALLRQLREQLNKPADDTSKK